MITEIYNNVVETHQRFAHRKQGNMIFNQSFKSRGENYTESEVFPVIWYIDYAQQILNSYSQNHNFNIIIYRINPLSDFIFNDKGYLRKSTSSDIELANKLYLGSDFIPLHSRTDDDILCLDFLDTFYYYLTERGVDIKPVLAFTGSSG